MLADLSSVWSAMVYEARAQGYWMGWNLLLAVLPGLGAVGLYKWRARRGALWWAGAVGVGLLLPNAPYVITDLIHLPNAIHTSPSRLAVVCGVLPLFVVLIAGGVLSYVLTLHLLRRELRRRGWSRRRRLAAEGLVDLLCAVGVALGRIPRLNSWDVFHPAAVVHGLRVISGDPRSIVIALAAIVLATLATDRVAAVALHALRAWRERTPGAPQL